LEVSIEQWHVSSQILMDGVFRLSRAQRHYLTWSWYSPSTSWFIKMLSFKLLTENHSERPRKPSSLWNHLFKIQNKSPNGSEELSSAERLIVQLIFAQPSRFVIAKALVRGSQTRTTNRKAPESPGRQVAECNRSPAFVDLCCRSPSQRLVVSGSES
jgi:hypothetical protein